MIVALVVLLLWVGVCCSGRNVTSDEKIRLEFWTISLKPTFTDYINDLIAEYQKAHPDVIIEWVDMPERVIMQKLLASIAGGVPPDVVNLSTASSQILAQNLALVCVDDAVSPEQKALYFENLWNSTGYEGKSYGIPWYVTTRVVMYNTDLFRLSGLDPGKPPETWDDVMEYSRIIKEKTGQYGYMPAIKILEDFGMHGVPVVSPDLRQAAFNIPEGVAVLDWYLTMKNKDIMPVETLSEGYKGALNRYQAGNLGMIIAGPTLLLKIKADAPTVYEKTAVAPMPLGKSRVVPAAIMNVVIPRGSKHRDHALDFALFVTNDRNQLAFCKQVPILPSTKAAAEDEYFVKGKGEFLQDSAIRISLSQLSRAQDMSLGVRNAPELSRVIHDAVEASFYGRVTSKKALDDAAKRWNEILNR